jgi:hypothetical protein
MVCLLNPAKSIDCNDEIDADRAPLKFLRAFPKLIARERCFARAEA